MQIQHPSTSPDYAAGELRSGTLDSKVLAQGGEGTANSYRMSFETAGADEWATPRHRHNFDQVRLQLKGSFTYAKDKSLTTGWVGYFPESVHYGPQVRDAGSITLVLQFGGASGLGFMSPKERRTGYDALAKKGKFEGGAFTYVDDAGKKHNKDAYEAVWEYMRGRKMEYPVPRYDTLINMNPENYAWVQDEDSPGVSRKHLGTFTERQFSVGFIQVAKGSSITAMPYPASQILFVVKGKVTVQGKEHGGYTAFALDPKEGPFVFDAVEDTILYHIRMPIFEKASGSLSAAAA